MESFDIINHLPKALLCLPEERPMKTCVFHPDRMTGRQRFRCPLYGRWVYAEGYNDLYCDDCITEDPYE